MSCVSGSVSASKSRDSGITKATGRTIKETKSFIDSCTFANQSMDSGITKGTGRTIKDTKSFFDDSTLATTPSTMGSSTAIRDVQGIEFSGIRGRDLRIVSHDSATSKNGRRSSIGTNQQERRRLQGPTAEQGEAPVSKSKNLELIDLVEENREEATMPGDKADEDHTREPALQDCEKKVKDWSLNARGGLDPPGTEPVQTSVEASVEIATEKPPMMKRNEPIVVSPIPFCQLFELGVPDKREKKVRPVDVPRPKEAKGIVAEYAALIGDSRVRGGFLNDMFSW